MFKRSVNMEEGKINIGEIEEFLFHEARLLDERRFEEWLDLFTEQAYYWLPMEHNQNNPHDTVSLIYDDRMSLEMRVRQFSAPNRHAQVPKTWTAHLIGNVVIDDAESSSNHLTVHSNCQVLESRGSQQRILGGSCVHELIRHSESFKIASKRVNLVNSDAPHDGINVPI